MSKYRAEQPIALSGWHSGTEIEITQVVTYSVTKHRDATLEQPEEPAMVQDIDCRYFLGDVEMQIGKLVASKFEDDDGFKGWLMSEAREHDEYQRDCAADAKREEANVNG